MKKIFFSFVGIFIAVIGGMFALSKFSSQEKQWERVCDGTTITSICTAEDGNRYDKYVYHEPEQEITEVLVHPAESAKMHIVHHDTVYEYREVNLGCIKTTISYKAGSCALSQCRDGEYSGSTGRGTCSYHGGVLRSGGPWYEYKREAYIVTPAWDELVVDAPAKDSWTETIVVSPAKDAYYEKELASIQ